MTQVCGHAIGRGVVNLEVAGVDNQAQGQAYGQAHSVRDAVAHAEELHAKGPCLHRLARLHRFQSHVAQPVLLQLEADETCCQARCVHWHVNGGEHVGQRAGVVLVSVGDENATDAVPVVLQIGDVRNDQVNTQHVRFWEHDAGVYDNDVLAILQGHHVLADLAQAAQGNYAKWLVGHVYLCTLVMGKVISV